jgi:hypothetical protein
MKYPFDRVQSCSMLEIMDFGRMMTSVGQCSIGFQRPQNYDFSFTFNKKIQIDRLPSYLSFEIWDFDRIMASMGQWSSKAQNWYF